MKIIQLPDLCSLRRWYMIILILDFYHYQRDHYLINFTGSMSSESKLIVIKTIHTIVWVFYNVVIFYLAYAVISDQIDYRVWICIGLVLLEGIILLVFNKMCPITVV